MARHERTLPLSALATSTLESMRAGRCNKRIQAEIDEILATRLRDMQGYLSVRALRTEDDDEY